ncbi:MAG: hypothetical protein E7011_03255 [Alphaproteobacteria bacterium]|nr:hypothetical protein [Alphaproteobacteria bacterium]
MTKMKDIFIGTLSAAGLAGLMFSICVLRYDSPNYDDTKMDSAKKHLDWAEAKYEAAQRRAILISSDTLAQDEQYLKLKAESNKEFTKSTTKSACKYFELTEKMEKLAEDLQSQHISKNKELIKAADDMKIAQDRVAQLQRDSVRADSLAKVPLSMRFSSNWNKMRQEYHNTQIKQHTLQLQKLQNERH